MTGPKVALVVDSAASIPQDLVELHNLHVIPQIIIWEGETYLDGVDITLGQFYERLRTAKEMPSTSQPSVGEFHEFFGKLAGDYQSIVGIFISSSLSGTVASATAAAKMLPDFPIEIVDSRSISMAMGFIALAAANAVKDGHNHIEAANAARDLVPKAKAVFVVDSLEYLHRSGRIGGARRLMGSMLSMKPLLHIDDGQIELLASVRTKRKALDRAIEIAQKEVAGKGPIHGSVVHSAAPDEAKCFKTKVESAIQFEELFISELSPAVGANVGPGVVALTYYSAG